MDFRQLLLTSGQEIVEQMPTANINHGQLEINKESPYVLQNPSTGQTMVLFDTSGQILDTQHAGSSFLVTKDRILMGSGGDKDMEIVSFKGVDKASINSHDLESYLALGAALLPIFHYLFLIALAWPGHICQAFLYSLAGLIVAKMVSVEIKFSGILRIASFAVGNVIVLTTIRDIFPIEIPGYGPFDLHIPFWELVQILIAGGYTLFGVCANLSSPSFEPVESSTHQETPNNS